VFDKCRVGIGLDVRFISECCLHNHIKGKQAEKSNAIDILP
jgi:hypothetical protein